MLSDPQRNYVSLLVDITDSRSSSQLKQSAEPILNILVSMKSFAHTGVPLQLSLLLNGLSVSSARHWPAVDRPPRHWHANGLPMDRPHARHLHLLAPVWTQQLPQHSRGLRLHLGSCEWPPPPSRWPLKSHALITLKVTDTDCQRVSSVCIYWTAVFSLSLFVSCLRAQEGRWDDSPCNLTLPSICKKPGIKTDGKPQHQDCKQVLLFSSLHVRCYMFHFLLDIYIFPLFWTI